MLIVDISNLIITGQFVPLSSIKSQLLISALNNSRSVATLINEHNLQLTSHKSKMLFININNSVITS